MCKMEALPLEILEHILGSPHLDMRDVLNFSATCNHFRNSVLSSNEIWKRKFTQKWPQFKYCFDKSFAEYYQEVRYVYELKNRIQDLLSQMAALCYKKSQLSDDDLKSWLVLLHEKPQTYQYTVSDLLDIINTDIGPINSIETIPLNTPGNKTQQYYSGIVVRYLKQQRLRQIWEEFINLPEEKQLLEKAAVIVAQWCQPTEDITYENISVQFDAIADLVKSHLSNVNPAHSIFSVSDETLNLLKIDNIKAHLWSLKETTQILNAMQEVICNQLGFHGNNAEYYDPQNSFLNKVLERRKGIPITLAVVYESVGRRLGIHFEPISFPRHFLVRFSESQSKYYYIDVFNGARIINPGLCPHSGYLDSKPKFPEASVRELTARMANNLHVTWREFGDKIWKIRSILEFSMMVDPQNLECVVHLSKLYMLHNIDTKGLQAFLTNQKFDSPVLEEQASRILGMLVTFHPQNELLHTVEKTARPPILKYAVGMIMEHSSSFKCVIHGWDSYRRTLDYANWQSFNLNFPPDVHQPFYHVLDEEGNERYVPQDELSPINAPGGLVYNEQVGRYFSHFFVNHFVPNAEIEREYRNDTQVRHKYYQDYVAAQQKFKLFGPDNKMIYVVI